MTTVHHRYATMNGRQLFYREAGPADAPDVVLLHGYLSWQQGPLAPGAVGRFLVPDPPPERLLYAEPLRRRMRVRFGGTWIADSEDVVLSTNQAATQWPTSRTATSPPTRSNPANTPPATATSG
jgi:hypothetical protein